MPCVYCRLRAKVKDAELMRGMHCTCPVRDLRRPMPVPTKEQPGSLMKILVLEQRADRGEQLWHPDDEKDLYNGQTEDNEFGGD